MKLNREDADHSIERQILVGMITNTRFLMEVKPVLELDLLQVPLIAKIAKWCLDYFNKYKKAPADHIQDLFSSYMKDENIRDVELELLSELLERVSEEYEQEESTFNVEYILDKSEDYFKKRRLAILAEDIKAELTSNSEVPNIEVLISKYNKDKAISNRLLGTGINLFDDKESMRTAFEYDTESLFTLTGALGDLINDQLTRDGFISILAPEKRGKTWWLVEMAIQAYFQRCNVAFFEVGDMSKSQIIRRIAIRITGRSNKEKYTGEIEIPVLNCRRNVENTCRKLRKKERPEFCITCFEKKRRGFEPIFSTKIKIIENPLTWKAAYWKAKSILKNARGKRFKLSVHPNKSINVSEIRDILTIWEDSEEFIPDVIVIDYADILKPEDNRKEFRQQQNETWQALRALGQEKNCLVMTATQADAASYTKSNISMANFSEDKRKNAHVTGMIALNQTLKNKSKGVMRLAWVILREGRFDENTVVTVLYSFEMGKPHLKSYWLPNVED